MDQSQESYQFGEPSKQTFDRCDCGRNRIGRSFCSCDFSRIGLQCKSILFSRFTRRAHSIAAQGGINAAKNYQGDGDSTYRLFYDTIKGGDYRSREANVHRLAEVSTNIIDQCVAQGVPFARIMVVCWTIVLLEEFWFPEPFMPKDKQDNNYCWEPIRQ